MARLKTVYNTRAVPYRMGIRMETSYLNVESFGLESGQVQVFAMGAPTEFYADTLHTIAINTRETEFGSIVEPIPITLKTYKPYQMHGHPFSYTFPQTGLATFASAPRIPATLPSMSSYAPSTPSVPTSPVREEESKEKITRPPKKKWIKEYLGKLKFLVASRQLGGVLFNSCYLFICTCILRPCISDC